MDTNLPLTLLLFAGYTACTQLTTLAPPHKITIVLHLKTLDVYVWNAQMNKNVSKKWVLFVNSNISLHLSVSLIIHCVLLALFKQFPFFHLYLDCITIHVRLH